MDIVITTNYEAYAEIVMLNDDQAAKEPRAVDARDVIRASDAATRAAAPA